MREELSLPLRLDLLRHKTIALLERLAEQSELLQLPKPTTLLGEYRRKLEANSYQVLVVGEVNRGKSSFVNALIGRPVLPTGIGATTSQVFRIRSAAQESYRVRYADGSSLAITSSDLPRYGSQIIVEGESLPTLDQIIRWIEVDIPFHFLLGEVSILDTPGLNSLYNVHTQITHRFVSSADAIIFVLDSWQPITQTELDFLEILCGITSHIFFVQTKIDKQRKQDWQAILERNQEILENRFKDRLASLRVWPISSTNLLEAVQPDQQDDDDYLKMSRYQDLSMALQIFLFRIAGWDLSAQAIQQAEYYYQQVQKALTDMLAELEEESNQKRTEMQKRLQRQKQLFEDEWGEYGDKHKILVGDLYRVASEGQQKFLLALSAVREATLAKIESLKSVTEAQEYNNVMAEQVIRALLEERFRIYEYIQQRYKLLLSPFLSATTPLNFPIDTSMANLKITHTQDLRFETNWNNSVKRALDEGNAISNLINTVFDNYIDTVIRPMHLHSEDDAVDDTRYDLEQVDDTDRETLRDVQAALLVLVWAGIAINTWFRHHRAQLSEAKQKLRMSLDSALQALWQQASGLTGSYPNHADTFFNILPQQMAEYVQKIVVSKSENMQAKIHRLIQDAELNEHERKVRLERTREQLAQWNSFEPTIKNIVEDLNSLDQLLGRNHR